jgi:hypothetical protein
MKYEKLKNNPKTQTLTHEEFFKWWERCEDKIYSDDSMWGEVKPGRIFPLIMNTTNLDVWETDLTDQQFGEVLLLKTKEKYYFGFSYMAPDMRTQLPRVNKNWKKVIILYVAKYFHLYDGRPRRAAAAAARANS